MVIFLISLFFAILFESSITSFPLVFLIILFLAVMRRSSEVFVIAFFSGLILDILSFGRIGFSSLYFTIFVFLIFMYQKKFEIETINFLVIFSFFGSLIYLFLNGAGSIFIQSVFSTFLMALSFIVFRRFNKKILKYT